MAKNKLITPFFLLCSALLVGCSSDTIVARPKWIDEKIFASAGDKDNKLKNIYDAIKTLGDTNASVLNNVLYKIAQEHIGSFEELQGWAKKTQDEIVADPNFKTFVDKHTLYKSEDKGFKKGDTQPEAFGDNDKLIVSWNKIKNQYDQIVEDVYEKLFDEIKGGTYSEDNLFYEQRFIMHLRKELYATNVYYNSANDTLYKDKAKTQVLPVVTAKFLTLKPKSYLKDSKYVDLSWKQYVNVEEATKGDSEFGFLHVTDEPKVYNDYIGRKILPDLYKNYLTQTYVRQQRYSSLGRSYARKVNMITIPNPKDDTVRGWISTMLNKYVTENIINKDVINYDFETLAKAMRGNVGMVDTDEAYRLLKDGGFQQVNVDDSTPLIWNFCKTSGTTETSQTHVFKGTKLGDLVDNVKKCCDYDKTAGKWKVMSPLPATGETAYNDITKNRTVDFELGLKIKEREILATDYTKDGWFLKNGGLTDLNSKFRDNLFNISTSTIIDKPAKDFESNDTVKYYGSKDPDKINNRKAFLADTKPSGETIILNDGSNFNIIEVEDAVNTAKLSGVSNNGSYVRLKAGDGLTDSTIKANKLISEVVRANSSNDTYKKNANEYYLMISNIVFYDQSVYDYFKSQFPDLFK